VIFIDKRSKINVFKVARSVKCDVEIAEKKTITHYSRKRLSSSRLFGASDMCNN